RLEFDPEHPEDGSLQISIDATKLWTDEPERDAHLRSADFLDVEHHPTITFKSTKVEPTARTEYKVTGDLTIRGVTRRVTLDVRYLGKGRSPFGDTRVGLTAEAISSRPGGSEQLRRPERKGLLSVFLPKSSPGADHRGDWGTRLRLAHCHPSQADGALLRSEETRVSPLADFPSPTSSSDNEFHGSI